MTAGSQPVEPTTFEEIEIGQSIRVERIVGQDMIRVFADLSEDHNPVHLDEDFAATTKFRRPIAHGALLCAFISAAIANYLPGRGSIYVAQDLRFKRPVYVGSSISVEIRVAEKIPDKRQVLLSVAIESSGELVAVGSSLVVPPGQ
jgi:3-hydroxybutyryl-CoA dehydratase